MTQPTVSQILRVLLLLSVIGALLSGCGESEPEAAALEPVPFQEGDECHVCGMAIADFPGPKGQAVAEAGAAKFCSTAEMFGWWLQPENQHRELALFVHDMGRSDWNHPDDRHLIDARTAWYVGGTGLKGAMGAVLASFADKQAAEALAREHGGRVLQFSDINRALLQPAAMHQQGGMSHGNH